MCMIKYPWKRLSNDCATGGLVKMIETPNVKTKMDKRENEANLAII